MTRRVINDWNESKSADNQRIAVFCNFLAVFMNTETIGKFNTETFLARKCLRTVQNTCSNRRETPRTDQQGKYDLSRVKDIVCQFLP